MRRINDDLRDFRSPDSFAAFASFAVNSLVFRSRAITLRSRRLPALRVLCARCGKTVLFPPAITRISPCIQNRDSSQKLTYPQGGKSCFNEYSPLLKSASSRERVWPWESELVCLSPAV